MKLTLRFLGNPEILLNNQVVQIGTRKAVALLAILAVTRERHQRDSLATLLWPEFDQQKAKASLRNALSVLKRGLGAEWFEVDRQAAGLNWEGGISADTHQFHTHLANNELEAAIDLYRADFMTGFTLRDAPAFDEWQFFEMEQLRQALARALEAVVRRLQSAEKWQPAIEYARRWVQLDPLHEPAQQQLITLYARSGQRSAALRQLEICQELFADELGIVPNVTMEAVAVPQARTPKAHHLPIYATSFIGRTQDLTTLADNLNHHFITLTGMGGMGKTRLAVEAANHLVTRFPDGLYYIDLVPLRSAHQIVPTIIAALDMPLRGADAPDVQLAAYLRDRQTLLIIDNFEHLMDGAHAIAKLRQLAPTLHILITSREILNLGGEWVYPLRGLPVPDGTAPAKTFSSVQLFVARARQLRPDFTLAKEEDAVVKICQLVEGMPLGIELAAAWVRLLPCSQIAQEIDNNADFLMTMQRDRPDRHRSMRAVFENSWGLLSAEEQQTLAQLSVFHAGATLAAARAVTQASLFALHGLVNRSLLRLEENGRYTLHELVRQFAYEKLAQNDEWRHATAARHCTFFINFLADNQTDADVIAIEIENVRQAWRWAGKHGAFAELQRGLQGLYFYFTNLSHYAEGAALLGESVAQLAKHDDDEQGRLTLGQLLARQGELTNSHGDLDAAQRLLYKAIAYLEPFGDSHALIVCYGALGLSAYRGGKYSKAQSLLHKAVSVLDVGENPLHHNYLRLSLSAVELVLGNTSEAKTHLNACLRSYQAHSYEWGIAHSLRFLGKAAYLDGALGEARDFLEKSRALCRQIDHAAGEALVLNGLGQIHLAQRQFEAAHELLQRALTLSLTNKVASIQKESFTNLGLLMFAWGEVEKAYHYFVQGLQATDSSPVLTLEILLGMAQIGRLPTPTVCNLIQQHPAADLLTKQKAATLSTVKHVRYDAAELDRIMSALVVDAMT